LVPTVLENEYLVPVKLNPATTPPAENPSRSKSLTKKSYSPAAAQYSEPIALNVEYAGVGPGPQAEHPYEYDDCGGFGVYDNT
jgi:hypothetical protein